MRPDLTTILTVAATVLATVGFVLGGDVVWTAIFDHRPAALPGADSVGATVLEVARENAPPVAFQRSELSSASFLLVVRVRLRGLPASFHPGELAVDRINGGASRRVLLRDAQGVAGDLWDYDVRQAGTRGPRGKIRSFDLRFVVPVTFRSGVLDYRGRALAALSL